MSDRFGCIIEGYRAYSPNKYQEELISFLKSDDFKKDINQILLDEANERGYVPSKSGALARNGKVQKNGIRYTLEYAKYQYWGEVYGPNWMCYWRKDGVVYDKRGWFSPPGKGSKHPTGREIGSVRATFYDNYGFEWKLGYTNLRSHARWIQYAYENNKRSISLKITNMLKRKLKNQ